MTIGLALGLSLISAAALNWGWVAQHDAANRVASLSLRAPLRSLRALFTSRGWVTGLLVGIGGWAAYVAALALAPLSLVQSVSAGGVALLAVFAHRKRRLARAQWWTVAAATIGLALLAVSLAGGSTAARAPGMPALVACIAALVAAAALSARVSLGAAAGILYGAGDVVTKCATFGGRWVLLVVLVLLLHGLASVALQLGFQRSTALASAGVSTLLTNALPIAAGVILFHERLPHGAFGELRVAGFVIVVAAAAALAGGLDVRLARAARPRARPALHRAP